jgi:ABC-type maltose transport system permease subunit
MAGSVLSSIPILVMFATLQRYFMAGLTAGSLK